MFCSTLFRLYRLRKVNVRNLNKFCFWMFDLCPIPRRYPKFKRFASQTILDIIKFIYKMIKANVQFRLVWIADIENHLKSEFLEKKTFPYRRFPDFEHPVFGR